MINKLISIMLCFTLLTSACAPGRTGNVSTLPTEAATDLYSPIEAVELAPLLSVEAPRLEQTAGAAPIHVSSGQTFVSPADGLFFTLPVASFILAELESLEARYGVSLAAQRELDMKRLSLTEETWRLRLNGDRERFRIIHAGDREEIERLVGLVSDSMTARSDFPWISVIISGGMLLLGIVVGFVSGFILLK